MQNEPNSRRRQVERGSSGVGRWANVQNEPNSAWLGQGWVPDRRKMQNEPNLARAAGRPIPGGQKVRKEPNFRRCRLGWGTSGVERRANAQNEANFGSGVECQANRAKRTQFRAVRRNADPRGQKVQNEPNLPAGAAGCGTRANRAKRTQFTGTRGGWARAGAGRPCRAAGPKRVKQSQLLRSGMKDKHCAGKEL